MRVSTRRGEAREVHHGCEGAYEKEEVDAYARGAAPERMLALFRGTGACVRCMRQLYGYQI